MDNDDLPVGNILTRREIPALFGTVGAGLRAGWAPGVATTSPGEGSTPTPGADGGGQRARPAPPRLSRRSPCRVVSSDRR